MARRILLLITDLEIGGTPTVVRDVASRLNHPPDVTVEVACLSTRGPVADDLARLGILVTALNCTAAFQFPLAVYRLVNLIRAGTGFDTVFSFLVHANVVAAAASLICRDIRFFQSIQTSQPLPAWHWEAQALIEPAAEAIVVPSPSVAKAANIRSGIPLRRVAIIPNAIDADLFCRSPVPATDERPYPIAFIGRLDPVKRIPDLLQAVRSLDGLVTLDVYGGGIQGKSLEALIRVLRIEKWVTLHGSIARPHEALLRAGLLVLPSEAEGFGIVLIEAMAAGVPVVATNVPGIRDVVRDGATGLLVDAASPESLAHAIRRIVEDKPTRIQLVENGLREVRERYAWQHAIESYRRLLRIR